MATKKRCHYDVLNVSRDCNEDDLKKAYRTAALKYHPDKNRGREEEAEEEFKLVQEAFEVLSDTHERAWYDSHRDQILRGKQPGDNDDEEGVTQATQVEIMDYFTSTCYGGYNDEEDGFYTIYRMVFSELGKEETVAAGRKANLSFAEFGTSQSNWNGVKQFYAQWESFSSSKLFGYAEKWNLSEAENREIRRAMDKENKKERAKAKKEYNGLVRELVMFVKKRDPRVKKQKKVEDLARAEREEELRIRQEEEKKRRKEWAEESKEAREKALEEDAAGLDEILASIALDDEKEKKKNRRKMRNANGTEQNNEVDDAEEEAEEEDEEDLVEEVDQEQYCIACKKKFRTYAQFENHNSTKKHRQAVNRLRRQIEKEDLMFFDARDDESVIVDTSRADDIVPNENDGVDSEGDDEKEEAPIEQLSKSQKKKNKKKKAKLKQMQSTILEEENDDEQNEDIEEIEEPIMFGSKNQKKKKKKRDAKLKQMQSSLLVDEDIEDVNKVDGRLDGSETPEEDIGASNKQKKKKRDTKQAVVSESNGNGPNTTEGEPVKMKPMSKREKRKERERRKAAQEKNHECNVCSEEFPSRTKLMKHVEKSGHARAVV